MKFLNIVWGEIMKITQKEIILLFCLMRKKRSLTYPACVSHRYCHLSWKMAVSWTFVAMVCSPSFFAFGVVLFNNFLFVLSCYTINVINLCFFLPTQKDSISTRSAIFFLFYINKYLIFFCWYTLFLKKIHLAKTLLWQHNSSRNTAVACC